MSGSIPFTTIAIGLVLAALALWALRGRRAASIARAWPTTQGRIVSATLLARRTTTGGHGVALNWFPDIRYEYEVAGTAYRGDRVFAGLAVGSSFRGSVERKLAQYPEGRMVQVFYNPANPSQAVLETTAPGSNILLIVAVIGAAMLIGTTALTMGVTNWADGVVGAAMNRVGATPDPARQQNGDKP